MALTDEQLDTIAQRHWIGIQKNPLSAHRALANPLESHREFARAIESAACAERDALIAKLRLEAQIHAQEARTANATIAEIYQAVTGSTGEPGNWNGAAPVKARIAELERQLAEARKDAERYRYAMDWSVSDFAVCMREDNDWFPCNTSGPIDNAMQKG